MALEHVNTGDPHVAAHNAERDAINALSDEIQNLNPAPTESSRALALRSFWTALAKADVEPLDIVVATSDSIGDGFGASSINKRWVNVVLEGLRACYQPSDIPGGLGYVDIWNQSQFPDHPRIGWTAPIANTDYGLGLQSLDMETVGQTVTLKAEFTTAKIAARTAPSSGYLFYTVDGGDPLSFNLAAPEGEHTEVIGPLPSGEHTIWISGGITADPYTIEGVAFFNQDEDSGIRLWEGGQSGYMAEIYSSSQGWVDALARIENPKLVILPIGWNDWATGRTQAQLKTSLEGIIASIQSAYTNDISIALVVYYGKDYPTHDSWDEFSKVYYEVASSKDNVTVIDVRNYFGPDDGGDRQGLLSDDLVHPSDAGHSILGQVVLQGLLPTPFPIFRR